MEHHFEPTPAHLTAWGIVLNIIEEKRQLNQVPMQALLLEVSKKVPWSIQETKDVLDQLVIHEVLTTGDTVNDTYYQLNANSNEY